RRDQPTRRRRGASSSSDAVASDREPRVSTGAMARKVKLRCLDPAPRRAYSTAVQTLRDKRALITGAASGIGKAIATRLCAEGAELVLVDVNEDLLAQTANELRCGGATVRTYGVDLTASSRLVGLREQVHRDGGPIDVLVNNAGVVFGGAFLDVPLERHLTTYRVNTEGLVAMTHVFLPDLIARPDAHLVNIASASGYIR